jgi:hypothetical protein
MDYSNNLFHTITNTNKLIKLLTEIKQTNMEFHNIEYKGVNLSLTGYYHKDEAQEFFDIENISTNYPKFEVNLTEMLENDLNEIELLVLKKYYR